MSLTITPRRGPQATLPALASGEIAITTDTYRLYVGTSNGNAEVGGTANAVFGPVQTTAPANGAGGAMPANADGWTQISLPDGTLALVPFWYAPTTTSGQLDGELPMILG